MIKKNRYNGYAYGEKSHKSINLSSVVSIGIKNKSVDDKQINEIRAILPYLNSITSKKGFFDDMHLSERESSIIKWASQGKSSWETAFILQLSERTVKFHLSKIYQKLSVHSKSHAVAKAYKLGLLI